MNEFNESLTPVYDELESVKSDVNGIKVGMERLEASYAFTSQALTRIESYMRGSQGVNWSAIAVGLTFLAMAATMVFNQDTHNKEMLVLRAEQNREVIELRTSYNRDITDREVERLDSLNAALQERITYIERTRMGTVGETK